MPAFDLKKFHTLKANTEEEYRKVGSLYCPALKSEVVFSSDGWHHLRYDRNRSERDKRIQSTKFKLFLNAIDTLKKSTTIQEYRDSICATGKADRSGFRKTQKVQWFAFWDILSFANGIRIRVIVQRTGDGSYRFWSVMPFWTLSNSKKIIGSRQLEDE